MKHELEAVVADYIRDLYNFEVSVEFTRPDPRYGDLATNVALQLAQHVHKRPQEIGEAIAEKLRADSRVAHVEVAGPGFLNVLLADASLWEALTIEPSKPLKGRTIVTEYSDPNPFKVLHAGHFYTSVVGDSISNLLQNAGGNIHRVNFGGDVGLHVGKTMWAILRELGGECPDKLTVISEDDRSDWMAKCYVIGTRAYEYDSGAHDEIISLNRRVYKLHEDNDHESAFAQIYCTCRQWSYDYFNAFYARIGSVFEKYYPESETAGVGLATVKEQLAKGVFEQSNGAVVFEGERYGLHTRVFINSTGLPTYETKDVGLILKKWEDYHFDMSVIVTGNDVIEYMKVVLKAIEQFDPNLAQRTRHVTHGNVKLAGGVKMSSRKGNILKAVDVLEAAQKANREVTGHDDESTVLAAIKYSFLKNRIGGDIIFDPKESVALEGNSGPYLQYAHARARSILSKISASSTDYIFMPGEVLKPDERLLVWKLSEYSECMEAAAADLLPHLVCTYLYELAQEFNHFYEKNRVIGDDREKLRIQLVTFYADILKDGLAILGIHAPYKM